MSQLPIILVFATALFIPGGHGRDQYADCPGWAARGDCQLNQGFMLDKCAASCADAPTGHQEEAECIPWANRGECKANPGYMLTYCANACAEYEDPHVNQGSCVDLDQYCEDWAIHGHCKINPGYMIPNCPKSCGECKVAPTQEEASGEGSSGSESAEENAPSVGGTSISALLGHLLPKDEREGLYNEQHNGK